MQLGFGMKGLGFRGLGFRAFKALLRPFKAQLRKSRSLGSEDFSEAYNYHLRSFLSGDTRVPNLD